MPIKKICFIIPTLRFGGAERVISILANEFVKYPETTASILLLVNSKMDYNIDPQVRIIKPKFSYNSNLWSKTIYTIKLLVFIRSTIKKLNPNAVLSFMAKYNNLVLIALLGSRIKIFVSDRSNPNRNIGAISSFLRKILYKKATGVVAQTEKAAKIIKKNTQNRNIKVIHNPLRKLQKLPRVQFRKTILNVGRNVPEKNQEHLIEMFSKMENNGWNLLIIGSGPLHQQLQTKIDSLLMCDKVKLINETSEIDYYFNNADIFAFVSQFEGFPNALSEALGHGLACISYNCPTGPDELIQNGMNGFLVDLNDETTFISKCNILMKSKSERERLGKNAIVTSKNFKISNISREYYDFLVNS